MTSAYPAPVETLIPQARELASELGQIPSRNKLMTEFKIGSKKANQILAALTEPGTDSTPHVEQSGEQDAAQAPATVPARRLHAVPDTAEAAMAEPARLVADSAPADQAGTGVSSPSTPDESTPEPPVTALANPAPVAVNPVGAWRNWTRRLPASWPLLLLALPAFVAIWSGWVGLGELTGFGLVHPLPGIADGFTLNTAITLPIGVETYAAYALRVALASGSAPVRAKRFAGWSAVASLVLGAAGQVAYHLMTVQHITTAPWWITTIVACLPVVVLGCGAALAHLQHQASTSDREVS